MKITESWGTISTFGGPYLQFGGPYLHGVDMVPRRGTISTLWGTISTKKTTPNPN